MQRVKILATITSECRGVCKRHVSGTCGWFIRLNTWSYCYTQINRLTVYILTEKYLAKAILFYKCISFYSMVKILLLFTFYVFKEALWQNSIANHERCTKYVNSYFDSTFKPKSKHVRNILWIFTYSISKHLSILHLLLNLSHH